jgi:xylulokinase
MFLGLDIGTSGVKAVLVDDRDRLLAQASAPLAVSRPQPLWSEQDPEQWWLAVTTTLDALSSRWRREMASVRAIGLSGQMLGLALLDEDDRPLRPAVLWDDGRATAECGELERCFPEFADVVGSRAMPGFTAPKLLWLSRHEPQALARTHRVVLPKDHARLRLSGEHASDRADSSATLLMDTRRGDWCEPIIAACGLDPGRLPRLVDSGEIAGSLRRELADRWGLPAATPIAGGAGDNMCAGVGIGAVEAGQAYIGLGTSGVYFLANDRFVPSRSSGMHTHRHAVPDRYCQNAVVLSAGAALAWVARLLRVTDLGALLAEVDAAGLRPSRTPVFTPYLSGERTPYDDPTLTATISGLDSDCGPHAVVHAVLEGVALALVDCHDALHGSAVTAGEIILTGGGARSGLWARLIAAAIGRPITVHSDAQSGPALGAARLARQAVGGPLIAAAPAGVSVPVDAALRGELLDKRSRFRRHMRLRD